MNKLYFISLLILPSLLIAQTSINLQDSEDNISGGVYEYTASVADGVDIPFEIKNMGTSNSIWRVTRLKVDVPASWSDLMLSLIHI